MARKSNKTDHVLSLLSSGGKDKSEDKSTSAPKPPVEPDKDKGLPSVSIVQSSSEKEGLADSIKKSLEDELEKMIPETAIDDEEEEAEKIDKMLKEEPLEPDAGKEALEIQVEPEEPQPEMAPELVISEHEDTAKESESMSGDTKKDTESGKDKNLEVAEGEGPPAQEQNLQKTGRDNRTEEAESEEEQIPFAFVNVMEYLVREKVVGYMEQFGNCTCKRCVEDTTALALTQLPPKYVVINKETVSPLMNFYTKKYAGQITVEITKACIRVGEKPHHVKGE